MPSRVIEIEGISKSFGARSALGGVSLDVAEGEIVALLGPNGGGKTTLFRILATLLRPDAGRVRLCGCDPVAAPADVRRVIGVVFQSPSLDKKLTVAENLRHHGHLYGLRGAELARRSAEALARVNLTDRAGDLVETLSGGLARRVEIAKGMLTAPRVLLLDEPSTGLDPTARRDLWTQLDHLRRSANVAILLTTHILDEAERCDRVVILDQGKVVAAGTPDALKSAVGGDIIDIVAADPAAAAEQIRARFALEPTLVDGEVHLEAADGAALIPKLAAALGDNIHSITLGRPTLEDAFIHVTGHAFDEERGS